jgi:type IV secretion system protein VirB8
MLRDPTIESYLAEAVSWDRDRDALLARSERRAWITAAAGWIAWLLTVAALAGLTPLKTVVPFVIRVDGSTGIVDVVPRYEGTGTTEELVNRYFLGHYVTVREHYSFASAESDYQETGAFNSPQLNQEWIQLWQAANPQSPVNLYKDGSTVRTQVKSISFFERGSGVRDLAQVRFTRTLRAAGGGHEQVSHWIATVQFAYVKPSDDPKDRSWNPLGFRVVEYRREPEVVEDTPVSGAGTAAAPQTGSALPNVAPPTPASAGSAAKAPGTSESANTETKR